MTSIDEFFDNNTGGTPVAAFDFDGRSDAGIGRSVSGEIVDVQVRDVTDPQSGEVRKDKNGNVIKQFVIDLQTELRDYSGAKKPLTDSDGNVIPDDGKRRIYMRYQGARAVVQAVLDSGAAKGDLRGGTGAKLAVKRIQNQGQMNQFEARFKKGDRQPAVEDAFGDFGGSSAPAAPAPAPSSQAAPWDSPSSDEPPF